MKNFKPFRWALTGFCWLVAMAVFARQGLVASVPFELSGSYVIIKVSINNSAPLNLILDTGIRNTIITELYPVDSLDIQIEKKQPLSGLGQGVDVQAMVSSYNQINLGKFQQKNKTVLILEKDIFGLSQHNGMQINGLAGIDILRDYAVEFDFTNKRLRFYDPLLFKVPEKYGSRDIMLESNKVYILLNMLDPDAKTRWIKMLLDTGAQLTAWFQTVRQNAIPVPERRVEARIGEGFGGEIYGYLARIPMICLDQFCIRNPIVVFPDSSTIREVVKKSDRDGTIGSELMYRFNYFLDFYNKKIYFKPNHLFKTEFKYNIAGIEVMQTLFPYQSYEVTHVWKDSPGERAGIIPGDVIVEINNEKAFGYSLSEIRGVFQTKMKSPLRMLVRRFDRDIVTELDMQDKLKLAGKP
jgi:hypothetical protein